MSNIFRESTSVKDGLFGCHVTRKIQCSPTIGNSFYHRTLFDGNH